MTTAASARQVRINGLRPAIEVEFSDHRGCLGILEVAKSSGIFTAVTAGRGNHGPSMLRAKPDVSVGCLELAGGSGPVEVLHVLWRFWKCKDDFQL